MSFDQTVFVPVDPDTAFALITQPERLRRWQTVAARVDLRVGGEYRWTMTPGHTAAGTFTEIEPGKHVVFTLGWEGSADMAPGASTTSTVSVTLDAVEGGTNVRLVHDGLSAAHEAGHAEGWNHFLGRLVALATTGDAGPDEWAAAPDPINELISAQACLAVIQRVLANLTDADAGAQTPCVDFTVAQLVDHLFGTIASIGTALGLDIVDQPNAAPEVRIADVTQPTLEAFAARGLDEYVLGLARTTISPEIRRASFAEETLVDESAGSLDRLIAFTGRQVAAV